ncbi:MAG TPA: S-layer homology domain-containing protein [Thermoanaerobaculia bacterium]|nr:S-layer homology domain-containing protein [Thermoanaerobaculia bacterium]
MVPQSPARRLGNALLLAALLPAAARAAQLARHETPAGPPRIAGPPAAAAAPSVACGPTTVTQSASQTILDQFSIACVDLGTKAHGDNSYWRAFDLRAMGVDGPVDVCAVSFGVESAISSGGAGQPLTVNLWDQVDRAFPASAQRVPLGTATVTVADQSLSILTVPIAATVPAGATLVVEVNVPDRIAEGDVFFFGANDQPETGTTYVSSQTCSIDPPEPLADMGSPDVHFVLSVTGTTHPLVPAALSVGDAPAYVVSMGDTFTVRPSWTDAGGSPVTLSGSAAPLLAPDGLTATIPDAAATYGAIAPSATADCGADCYSVQLAGTRPDGHVDVVLSESLEAASPAAAAEAISPAKDWTIHVGHSFADVPSTDLFYPFIENVLHNGVTAGGACGGYCPGDTALRKQMAAFVLRAIAGPAYTPSAATGVFTDVPADDPFAPWIEEIYHRGIVAGCAPGPAYCPDAPVLRQQMAVFLLRALEGLSYAPPACEGVFEDVPCPSLFADWVEDLYARGITGGCSASPLLYCPTNAVTRGQMAPFLVKTFSLVLYGP